MNKRRKLYLRETYVDIPRRSNFRYKSTVDSDSVDSDSSTDSASDPGRDDGDGTDVFLSDTSRFSNYYNY